jgi:peptide/nickel transport system substrate-binding protein
MRNLRDVLIGLTVTAALAGPAAAENVLRFTGFVPARTFDPHSHFFTSNRTATEQVYEPLLDVDSNFEIVPMLAVVWKPLDATTWEFELRRNVRFHDGAPFTAEDVVFSLERARAKTADLEDFVGGIADVRATDDHTVQVTTHGPDPVLWLKLWHVAIMSKAWAARNDVTLPADFKGARAETYASRHANGTGPFMLENFEPSGDYVLVRNPDWWGAADYPHNIDRIVHIWTGEPERDVQALVEDKIDLILDPPYATIDRVRDTPGLKLGIKRKQQTFFLGVDLGAAELQSSDVKGRNPFADKRVRQAMYHAIDIEAALRDLMGELLLPAGMLVAPGVNGYSPELDTRPPHDPVKAKALLVDAGYPDGFSVTLDCPNNYGDDELTMCRGAAAQLAEVGIEVAINYLPGDELIARYSAGESDFYLDAWPSEPDSERILKMLFHSRGRYNTAGYANPRVDELIEKIQTEMVTYARDAYLEEAWRIVTDDIVYLPVRHSMTVFAMRDRLELPVDPWAVPRFRLARLKEPGG